MGRPTAKSHADSAHTCACMCVRMRAGHYSSLFLTCWHNDNCLCPCMTFSLIRLTIKAVMFNQRFKQDNIFSLHFHFCVLENMSVNEPTKYKLSQGLLWSSFQITLFKQHLWNANLKVFAGTKHINYLPWQCSYMKNYSHEHIWARSWRVTRLKVRSRAQKMVTACRLSTLVVMVTLPHEHFIGMINDHVHIL